MRQEYRKSFALDERNSAFSLVEITLAIGIFAFAIVGLLALMNVSMASNKEAAIDTALLRMTDTVVSLLKTQDPSAILASPYYSVADDSPDFYFNFEGRPALNSSQQPDTHPAADSFYSCTIRRSAAGNSTPSLFFLQIEFRWPLGVVPDRQQSREVNLSMAKHD